MKDVPDQDVIAILVAVLGVAGVTLGGLFKLWRSNKIIHHQVNSNFNKMTRDLRYTLAGVFVLIMASISAVLFTAIVIIVAIYKAIARLREPEE